MHATALVRRAAAVCSICSIGLLAVVAGCATKATPTAWRPAMPAVDEAIEPLGFMAGTWVMEQRGGAVIEEHWMAPAGTGMLGSVQGSLGNGVTLNHRVYAARGEGRPVAT